MTEGMFQEVLVFIAGMTGLITASRLLRTFIVRKGGPSTEQLSVIEARIQRIEQIVESSAIEIERVSEGQRFTTRLLSEQLPPPHDAL